MSRHAFALVRDLVPVVGVVVLALFVLWQGAERRQRAEVERSHRGMASDVPSSAESSTGVQERLAEASEPRQAERRGTPPAFALSAGLGISALAAVFSVAYPRVRRRARRWHS